MTVIRGTHAENTLVQLADVASRAEYAALMADGHLGYIMPVGGVAAYLDKVSVAGVGFDIGCGNTALVLDEEWTPMLEQYRVEMAREIADAVSFGVGRKNEASDAPDDHVLFDDALWRAIPAAHREPLLAKARQQLGTVGSGNHYVDLFRDEVGRVVIGVHFGSRGLGHGVATGFMNLAQDKAWDARGGEVEALLDIYTPLGAAYWGAKTLASHYAEVGRQWVADKVRRILFPGSTVVHRVSNHHNDAWYEEHFGKRLTVVRKGATPAFPGQYGFVGGSMGDMSVILRGRESAESAAMLYSTVHGAGRVMSRTQAKGKKGNPGLVSPEMMQAWLQEQDVVLHGGGLDESPHAYRRLPEVLAAQGDTIEVVSVLRPRVVVMAGANEFDPYKD